MIKFKIKLKWLALSMSILMITMVIAWGDEAVVKCSIKEKKEGVVIAKVLETGIYKRGTTQAFYLAPNTKIIMANSETPLLEDNLLVGDKIRVVLGKVEKMKNGELRQFVVKIFVSPSNQIGKSKVRKQ